jgi:hypothetical protein
MLGDRLQERYRRSARVTVADHHRIAAKGGRGGLLQRPLLPYRRTRSQLQPEDDLHAAGQSGSSTTACSSLPTTPITTTKKIVSESKLVVDSRNATRGIKSDKIVHC